MSPTLFADEEIVDSLFVRSQRKTIFINYVGNYCISIFYLQSSNSRTHLLLLEAWVIYHSTISYPWSVYWIFTEHKFVIINSSLLFVHWFWCIAWVLPMQIKLMTTKPNRLMGISSTTINSNWYFLRCCNERTQCHIQTLEHIEIVHLALIDYNYYHLFSSISSVRSACSSSSWDCDLFSNFSFSWSTFSSMIYNRPLMPCCPSSSLLLMSRFQTSSWSFGNGRCPRELPTLKNVRMIVWNGRNKSGLQHKHG